VKDGCAMKKNFILYFLSAKQPWFPYLIISVIVPLAGEFTFYPLSEEFRVSFATPALLLLLLYFQNVRALKAGVIVGITVVLFRTIIGTINGGHVIDEFFNYLPVLSFYLTYGFLFSKLELKKYMYKPLLVGLSAWVLEVCSMSVSVGAHYIFNGIELTVNTVVMIFLLGIVRTCFALGIFMLILYSRLQEKALEQRKKNDHILLVISDLHVELIQLKKSIRMCESTTSETYFLSKRLKEKGDEQSSSELLKISGQIHECKKDGQRIFGSLANLITKQEFSEWLAIHEILELVVRANKSYAEYLGKSIKINTVVNCDKSEYHSYFILSIINNLVANSIEAINYEGRIDIRVMDVPAGGDLFLTITDNGPGIATKHQSLIFTPGFTTKYSQDGTPSNGIGLTYIRDSINKAGGSIKLLKSIPNLETTFYINIPNNRFMDKEDAV